MARYPGARWRGPVPNYTPGGMGAIKGLVLHVQQGSESGTDAWLHNPASQVSAHFGNPKSGPLDQWVDTADRAWAEVSGNSNWISLENEGNSGDSLTPGQLENAAQLLAWLHGLYGVPLQLSNSTIPGLTGHGLGGTAWGGHFDCPGPPILAQRQQIIDRAAQIAGAPTTTPAGPDTEDDMPIFSQGEIPQDTDAHMVVPPPSNLPGGQWGSVWFSLGSDFGDATVRCAAYVHGAGWDVRDNVVVPAAGDRVNPWGGPLPAGTQKISIVRKSAGGVLGYLIEAAHR